MTLILNRLIFELIHFTNLRISSDISERRSIDLNITENFQENNNCSALASEELDLILRFEYLDKLF